MSNLALNKYATASSFVAPFTPAKAVDGSSTNFSRWLGNQVPAWLCVDLGDVFWVNRWVVKQMGGMGWSLSYNLCDYKFQGSLDNANWFDLDSVTSNSSNQTDRIISGRSVRYVRVYVTKGLGLNNQFSSVAEFEVHEAANAPYLDSLAPSVGTLSPAFAQKQYAYSVSVGSETGNIRFTPAAAAGMVIKVNGTVVTSGQQSAPISLNPGDNPVTVTVTSAGMTASYTVNVVKAGQLPIAKLGGLAMVGSDGHSKTLNPAFGADIFGYAVPVANAITWVKVNPAAGTGTTAIKVNGVTVASGSQSPQINLNVGSNTITVTASGGGYSDGVYTITVTRA